MNQCVPFRSGEEIERDAFALFQEYAKARGARLVPPIPVEDIVEKHLKLRIEFDDMHARLGLPRAAEGQAEILGAAYGDGSIFIDESLDPEEHPEIEARYRFTVVHELGHVLYHPELVGREGGATSSNDGNIELCDDRSDDVLRSAEWQANRFAACMLVPLPLLAVEWFSWRKSLQPFVFSEWSNDPRWWSPSDARSAEVMRMTGVGPNHSVHKHAFNVVAKLFAPYFAVSTMMMRIRLEQSGLLLTDSRGTCATSAFSALPVEAYQAAARDRIEANGRILCH